MPCRMFGYVGTSEADVCDLYSGLKRACADDPTLGSIAPGCSRHSHGWGYVIHAANGLFHYRSAKSIYDDDAALPKLEGQIHAIFHGRFATDTSLMGHIFCHPFVASTEREIIFFAHNGSVNPDQLPSRNVDSEWAFRQMIQSGSLAEALPKLKERTQSALNLLVLSIDRNSGAPVTLQSVNYFTPTEQPKVDYYRMFLGKMPGGRALVSSTLTLPGAHVKNLTVEGPAPFGELLTIEA